MATTRGENEIAVVNIYRASGEWCYAAFTLDGGFDCSDTIGVDDDAREDEAREAIRVAFPGIAIKRVGDIGATRQEG